jgi:dihydroorotase
MYDLLLKGARVIDPSQGINSLLDVGIKNDVISKISHDIPTNESIKTLPLKGNLITPGLIDIHSHVYRPSRTKIHPDVAGVLSGVTSVVDAGGADSSDFPIFEKFIRGKSESSIYAFLNITQHLSILPNPTEEQSILTTVQTIANEHPQLVKGIKVSVDENWVNPMGLRHLEFSKRVARDAGIRLMMHIGDFIGTGASKQSKQNPLKPTPSKTIGRAISMLDCGDILTHAFTPRTGGTVDENGRLLPALKEAQLRGVTIDTAYGNGGFGFQRAEEVLTQGFIPDTIGSDVEIQASTGALRMENRGLIEYLAFFFVLGFSLNEIIQMTTINPARALGIEDQSGSLKIGRTADISILNLIEGKWKLIDAQNHSRSGNLALVPVMTIKSGQVIDLGTAPHPWGWTPPSSSTPEKSASAI